MRDWVGVGLVLSLLAVSGVAVGHPAATSVEGDEPVMSFEESFCLPMCEVRAHNYGFLGPTTVVRSGSVVEWTVLITAAGYHTATSHEKVEKDP
ncbi:MAG: hypothetical protein R3185_09440, partial [Candidatus Thermoplasmatota archaeon]|nr:hypothetical protein [Candidatus Thermoplasmatota archaeon]